VSSQDQERAKTSTFFANLIKSPVTYIRYKLGDEILSFKITMEEILLSLLSAPWIISRKVRDEIDSLQRVRKDLGYMVTSIYFVLEMMVKFPLLFYYLFIIYPGASMITFFLGFGSMVSNTTFGSRATIKTPTSVYEPPLRAPTFYSPEIVGKEKYRPIVISALVALIFGSIHCIAWNSYFPSAKEHQYWSIASTLVTCAPVVVISIGIILLFVDENSESTLEFLAYFFLMIAGGFSVFFYTMARLCLLILPLISLRRLPPTAYYDINWTVFVPHIHI